MKEKLAKFTIVQWIYKCLAGILGIFEDRKSRRNLIAERKIERTSDKIRVGFLCQYIPAWNKTSPVYEVMKRDSRFEVFLICVPDGMANNCLPDEEDMTNDTYEYFKGRGYDAMNALIGKNQWLDLKEMNLDCIFFPRPYNNYLPKQYASGVVSRYTKICYLMYAMTLTKEVLKVTVSKHFFRDVFCYFAEGDDVLAIHKKHFKHTHAQGLQRSVNCGIPALSQMCKAEGSSNTAWDFSKNAFRVIWTPRWTTDPALGGTNFFQYKDVFLTYAREHEDMDFLFRPHPLMFGNFIKTGIMTEEEVREYKNAAALLPNVAFDVEKEYEATFWNSSVLVSDISGILVEYFVTGKPIIYCASNMKLHPTEMLERMLEGCYIVYTEEELWSCIEELKKGRDDLAKRRKAIAEELFGTSFDGAAERIVEELAHIRAY